MRHAPTDDLCTTLTVYRVQHASCSHHLITCASSCRFANHQKPLAILRKKTQEVLGKSAELVKPAATRFGTHTYVGQRLLQLQLPLQQTVFDPAYIAEGYKDAPDEQEQGNCETYVRQHKGGTAKKFILEDGELGTNTFWGRVSTHVKATLPICKLLRRHDSSAPTVGKVYSGWFELGETIKELPPAVPYKLLLEDKHAERWAYGHSDFLAAAYVLDPEFINHKQSENEEVVTGFLNTVEKIGILVAVKAMLAENREQLVAMWEKRAERIAADPSSQQTWADYPEYPTAESPEVKSFCAKVNAQLALYRGKKGVFARDWVMEASAEMPAYQWWDNNCGSVPQLQTVARFVLAQPASASICERINSEFAFVKDRRRNGLLHDKSDKLVGLFHNLRLMKRMKKPAYVEPAVGWTESEKDSGITKYGITNY